VIEKVARQTVRQHVWRAGNRKGATPMLHAVGQDFRSVDDPLWAPGVPCPRCGKRHKTWFRVASCRWHKVANQPLFSRMDELL
jgi:hypothetical protein